MTATMPTATTTAPPAAARPRRPRVHREPSQRAAARALRRSATPTTTTSWTRAGLPGRAVASAGVPLSESLMSVGIVAFASIPLFVFTQGSAAAWITLASALVVMSYVLWARRVVVGTSWVAVRQLGRYHVATVDHVKHLELKPSQHGGVLCLHTDDGRCMRLRRAETTRPDVNAALRALAAKHEGTHDPLVEELLELPHDESHLRHRYLADALQ